MWSPATGAIALPVEDPSAQPVDNYLAVFSVSSSGELARLGTISQPAAPSGSEVGLYSSPEIERALVVGDTLFSVSEQGTMANDLTSLSQVAWLPFTGAAQ